MSHHTIPSPPPGPDLSDTIAACSYQLAMDEVTSPKASPKVSEAEEAGPRLEIVELGRAFKLIRIFMDRGLVEACTDVKISTSCLCDLENGKRVPQIDTLYKLCDYYGVSLPEAFVLSEKLVKVGKAGILREMVSKW